MTALEAAVANPFEDASAKYLVLRNGEGQYSLWPDRLAIPEGWDAAFEAESRLAAVEFVDTVWQDMRPASLVRHMRGD
jgi:MbtH protein